MMRSLQHVMAGLALVTCLASFAAAQTFDSGSTGVDGAFAPTANVTLALPPSGVFNFTTITIPAGVTVTFTRNATNTPVTMLAQGNVVIAGTIDVSGAHGGLGKSQRFPATLVDHNAGAGGPGGFDGGRGGNGLLSFAGGSGLGPGGGTAGGGLGDPGGGSFATAGGHEEAPATYGSAALLPLIGGSGGAGGASFPNATGGGGGGGGGAIVVATSGRLTFTGRIVANGGNGGSLPENFPPGVGAGGSGGAVRLVATDLVGSGGRIEAGGGLPAGTSFASAGQGGLGWIRLEAFRNVASITLTGISSSAQPTSVRFPEEPTLRIASIAGVTVPAVPVASYLKPDVVLPYATTSPVAVVVQAANIPPGTPVTVSVKGRTGGPTPAVTATLAGTQAASVAEVNVMLQKKESSVILATASFTITAASGGPVFVDGEVVEHVHVAAAVGGRSQVTYVTRSGRALVVAR